MVMYVGRLGPVDAVRPRPRKRRFYRTPRNQRLRPSLRPPLCAADTLHGGLGPRLLFGRPLRARRARRRLPLLLLLLLLFFFFPLDILLVNRSRWHWRLRGRRLRKLF